MNNAIFGDLRKTSATIDGKFSTDNFDLDVIYDYLPVGGDILFVKYNNLMKTSSGEDVCKTFNNQVTIKMKNGVNIKIFKTRTFSLSGAGNVDTALDKARKTLDNLLIILNGIRTVKRVKVSKNRGLYTYYNRRIVTRDGDEYICNHEIRNTGIIINGKNCIEFDIIPGVYVEVKHENKIKLLYNNLAEEIGEISYLMKRNSKSLCIKDCTYIQKEGEMEYFIINPYGNEIGTLVVKIHEGKDTTPVELPEYIDLKVAVCDYDTKVTEIKFSNCNYNMKLKNETAVDRNMICDYLDKNGMDYVYNPSSYPGVKFTLDGDKITIFRTGSVLISSKNDITKITYPFIIKMFENDFSIKTDEDNVSETDSSLTIWDL